MKFSIRTKLTFWYLSIVGVALLISGAVLYFLLSNSFLKLVDSSLLFYAKSLAANATTTAAPPPEGDTPLVNESQEDHSGMNQPLFSAQLVQFVDEHGQVTQQVMEQAEKNLFGKTPPMALGNWKKVAATNTPEFEIVYTPGGQIMRIVTLAVRTKEENFFISVGQDLDDLARVQSTLLWILGSSIPTMLLLLGLGGWLLVSQTLRPVDQLTRAAQRIGEGNLHERVEMLPTGDELARLAETFNQMITKVEAAFERQKQFTADASHELRTPLAVMRGELELILRREQSPEKYRHTLESMLEETLRLSKLVDDLLTLARSDSGEIVLEQSPVDVTQLCQEMYEYIAPLAESHHLTLTCTTPNSPRIVQGDQQRLRRLLLNLLDNALKYTPSGGHVAIRVEDGASNNSNPPEVQIFVSDDGPGIPPADQERIFDRFYRHCHTGSNEQGGFGLGLSICRWIAQAHGGKLMVDGSAPIGSTFKLILPAAKV